MKTKQWLLYSTQQGVFRIVWSCLSLTPLVVPSSGEVLAHFVEVHLGSHKIFTFKSEEHALSQNKYRVVCMGRPTKKPISAY